MKNYILKTSIFLISFSMLMGCDLTNHFSGSEDLVTIERDLDSFQNIIAGENITVKITQGPIQQILATTNTNMTENLITKVEDNTLKISLKNGSYKNSTFILDIQVPDLKKLKLKDAAEGELSMISEVLNLEMQDASKLTLNGNANTLNIEISDAGKVFGFGFLANTVNVGLKDASKLEITVVDILQGKATDASKIMYRGNPIIEISTTDAAKVINEN
ncbi:hypothetical protein E4S40_07655 [Algoriphagus kandeliae]|uniref:Putative auto-transporter adhesin head GIN domain-containing protein n=1 Tax=Algoriphagus kandeliae TaxID=2562278 RepID=A0A4Y9QWR0_9BACT|nr:DUF2807 domain-containing protein [Algoriphagus kandeliae]TFV96092.1 hypothetical protein E4S40_07655 [Algoriphagus kandeliae]